MDFSVQGKDGYRRGRGVIKQRASAQRDFGRIMGTGRIWDQAKDVSGVHQGGPEHWLENRRGYMREHYQGGCGIPAEVGFRDKSGIQGQIRLREPLQKIFL